MGVSNQRKVSTLQNQTYLSERRRKETFVKLTTRVSYFNDDRIYADQNQSILNRNTSPVKVEKPRVKKFPKHITVETLQSSTDITNNNYLEDMKNGPYGKVMQKDRSLRMFSGASKPQQLSKQYDLLN